MSWMNTIGSLLQQYSGGATTANPGQVEQHYDQVAQNAPLSTIASGLASAIRSDQTPSFGQIASQLFGNSGANQQASLLNSLLATAGPAILSSAMSGGNLSNLQNILGGNQPRQLTPEEAAQVPTEEIQHLANHVERHDPSIVDRVSEIYAQHPGVVKTLGGAVLSICMARIAQHVTAA